MNRFLFLLLVLFAACSETTHITVQVTGDEVLSPEAELTVVVRRADGTRRSADISPVNLPETLTVLPENGRLGTIFAEATLVTPTGEQRAEGHADFVEGSGETLLLHLGRATPMDGGTEADAGVPSDAGAPMDATTPIDSAVPDAGLGGCEVLELPSAATALDAMTLPPSAPTREVIAVASGSLVRYFRRDASELCFADAGSWDTRTPANTLHLNLDSSGHLWATASTDESVLVQRIVPTATELEQETFPAALGSAFRDGSAGLYSGSDAKIFGVAQRTNGIALVGRTEAAWENILTRRSQTLWDVQGSGAIIGNGVVFSHWTIQGGASDPVVQIAEISTERDLRPILFGTRSEPRAVLLRAGEARASVYFPNMTGRVWSPLGGIDLRTDLHPTLERHQFDGNGGHWSAVAAGMPPRAVHVIGSNVGAADPETIDLSNTSALDVAIASLANGVAYIDDAGMVSIARRP